MNPGVFGELWLLWVNSLIYRMMSGVTPAHLCLDDVPGVPQANVIFWVVEGQAVLQVLLGVLSHLENKRDALIRQLGLKALVKQELSHGRNYSLYSGVRRWRVFLRMHSNYLFKLLVPLFHRYAIIVAIIVVSMDKCAKTVLSGLLVERECLITHHFCQRTNHDIKRGLTAEVRR